MTAPKKTDRKSRTDSELCRGKLPPLRYLICILQAIA
jgi:hypothetical protein